MIRNLASDVAIKSFFIIVIVLSFIDYCLATPPDKGTANDWWMESSVNFKSVASEEISKISNTIGLHKDIHFRGEYHVFFHDDEHPGSIHLVGYDIYILKQEENCTICTFIIAHKKPDDPNTKWIYRTLRLPMPLVRISPDQRCKKEWVLLLEAGNDKVVTVGLVDDNTLVDEEFVRRCD